MHDPWLRLPETPEYVLDEDRELLLPHTAPGRGDGQIRLEMIPVPYIGSPETADLFLLNLNPSFSLDRLASMRDPYYVEQSRKGLEFRSTYPFWPMDPGIAGKPIES